MPSHFVYKVTFPRLVSLPDRMCYYIGSKSNATFENGILYDNKRNEYWGSSREATYKSILLEEEKTIEILFFTDNYAECLAKERDFHLKYDVVTDKKYFNKTIACDKSTYTDPEYGTFRHKETRKFVRLKKDHPLVISGDYVNANFGMRTYNDGCNEKQYFEGEQPEGWILGRLDKNILRGERASFYGKIVTKESKDKFRETKRINDDLNPERVATRNKLCSERAKNMFSGTSFSEDHRKKISDSSMGYVTLKNKITGESIRIYKHDLSDINSDVWVNAYSIRKDGVVVVCPHCGKHGENNNSSFIRWHFDKCKHNPNKKSIPPLYAECGVCHAIGDMNNSSFKGKHFANCNCGKWEPWNNKCKNDLDALGVYSTIGKIYELLVEDLPNFRNMSMKAVSIFVMEKFCIGKTSHLSAILKKIKYEEYNPYSDDSWLKKFKGEVNESS